MRGSVCAQGSIDGHYFRYTAFLRSVCGLVGVPSFLRPGHTFLSRRMKFPQQEPSFTFIEGVYPRWCSSRVPNGPRSGVNRETSSVWVWEPSWRAATIFWRSCLADRKDRIELVFLPPYAPESNPDEYLTGIAKPPCALDP